MAETRPPAPSPWGVPSALAGRPEETGLLERARAGDGEAFRVIFEAHAPAVRRFLGDVLRDGARADDATQETFVRAHARLASLREGERLAGWLFGIARLVSLEQQRSLRRDGAIDNQSRLFVSDGGGETAAAADRAPTPEAALLAGEAERVLGGALATLSEERRAALLLRLDHGLAYGEIGEAMGWTLQKVKNEIHRARLQLREKLAGYLEDAP
jgi:RNA polymerase sigma-70 factor (ECF subfamily)